MYILEYAIYLSYFPHKFPEEIPLGILSSKSPFGPLRQSISRILTPRFPLLKAYFSSRTNLLNLFLNEDLLMIPSVTPSTPVIPSINLNPLHCRLCRAYTYDDITASICNHNFLAIGKYIFF